MLLLCCMMLAGSMITSEHVHMQVGTAAMYALASWVEHTGPQIVRPQLGTLAGLLSGTALLTLCVLLHDRYLSSLLMEQTCCSIKGALSKKRWSCRRSGRRTLSTTLLPCRS